MITLMTNIKLRILFRKSRALAFLCVLGAVTTTALANNLTVNNLTDIELPGDGQCTLREAIGNTDTDSDATGGDCTAGSGMDSIDFSASGTVLLSSTLNVNDTAGLVIDGVGQNVTLSGNNVVRVLHVNPAANLTLKNLTVANGFDGGDGFGFIEGGGGIYNQFGTLAIEGCTFSGNSSSGKGGGIANYGNIAVNPDGKLTVINSTFSGNNAFYGGAIWNASSGKLSATNITVVGNSAITPLCVLGTICTLNIAEGGGISNSGLGPNMEIAIFNLDNSIVAGNNTIVKGSTSDLVTASDIYGFVTGGGYNLIGTTDGILGGLQHGVNGNFVGIDVNTVLNTTLATNGGSTQTLALLTGSPATDAVPAVNCPATDQRGVSRPQGTGCDIGAFEVTVEADLAVTETVTPNPAMVSDNLTWIITVANNGSADATGVKVIDALPVSGFNFTSAIASQGTCDAPMSGVITCSLGNLANAEIATITIAGIPTEVGTLSNQVTVTSDQPDNQPANSTATQAATVQTLLCNGMEATIVGTPEPDTLKGTRERDIIHSLGGNDTINGGNGNDIICGGEGLDTLYGESGDDFLDGEAGMDSCNGGEGSDTIVNCEAKIKVPQP